MIQPSAIRPMNSIEDASGQRTVETNRTQDMRLRTSNGRSDYTLKVVLNA